MATAVPQNDVQTTSQEARPAPTTRSFLSPAVSGPQNLVFPVLVALACWGMVGYFLLLTTDANYLLFAGMAGVMALLWSFSVGIRIRKLLQRRRSSPRGRRDQIYRVPE